MSSDEESREFFRIEDRVALRFAVAGQPQADQLNTLESPLFDLLGELHLLDYESQHLLRQIAERDRTLASYLKGLNRRIDLLGRTLATELSGDLGPQQDITLSEGGLSFRHLQPIEPDTPLILSLILLPAPLGLRLKGRVIYCRKESEGDWLVGVNFEDLGDAQRQLLARHIVQKQAQEIRASKQQEGTPS